MNPAFRAEALEYRYHSATRAAVDKVSLEIAAGDFYAVIGPNGSGKSTLLKLLLGVAAPTSGRALYEGQPATDWDRRQIARRIGVVTQHEDMTFPFTVREIVAMGRYPHLGPWQREGTDDGHAIELAMQRCDVTHLQSRVLANLSGGERQRARIARALAQEPSVLMLDEPTTALDVGHEMAVFELLAQLREQDGTTVVIATHNLNLAARFANRIALLDGGRLIADGAPADVMTQERLARVYRWPVVLSAHPGPGVDAGAPQVNALRQPANEQQTRNQTGLDQHESPNT